MLQKSFIIATIYIYMYVVWMETMVIMVLKKYVCAYVQYTQNRYILTVILDCYSGTRPTSEETKQHFIFRKLWLDIQDKN